MRGDMSGLAISTALIAILQLPIPLGHGLRQVATIAVMVTILSLLVSGLVVLALTLRRARAESLALAKAERSIGIGLAAVFSLASLSLLMVVSAF
jgi:hypothetical protein